MATGEIGTPGEPAPFSATMELRQELDLVKVQQMQVIIFSTIFFKILLK